MLLARGRSVSLLLGRTPWHLHIVAPCLLQLQQQLAAAGRSVAGLRHERCAPQLLCVAGLLLLTFATALLGTELLEGEHALSS